MEDKKVAVIMSTYNGERFVREQMDSILNQTYKNIEIIVRDDGSKDGTVKIIKEYEKKHNNIRLYEGQNLGFIKSFFKLLEMANADYYAYADQDDVWMENKIELAVNLLNEQDDSKPNMAFGNSDYYDENMKLIGKGEVHRKCEFKRALFACITQGMTMTINQKAKDMIVNNPPKNCFFHDWWTYLICISMGNVSYSDVTTVKYRRMKTNATSEGQGVFSVLKWRIKNLLINNQIKDIKGQMLNFKDIYYNDLDEDKKKMLDLFADNNYNFFRALRKTFYPKRLRAKLFDDIMLRFIFLFGIL